MINLVPIWDPVVRQIQEAYLLFAFKILDLSNEVIVQVEFDQIHTFLKSFDLFDFIEWKYKRFQIDQFWKSIHLLDFVVKEVDKGDIWEIVFTANAFDDGFIHFFKLASHWDVRWHRVFNCCLSWILIIFNEFIVIIHKFFDVALAHNLMKVLFETSHIRPVQIIRRQMDILQSGIISLSISDIGVLKNALGFSDSFEQLVAFLIQSTDIR